MEEYSDNGTETVTYPQVFGYIPLLRNERRAVLITRPSSLFKLSLHGHGLEVEDPGAGSFDLRDGRSDT